MKQLSATVQIDVIVPVYNGEAYIESLIRTFECQTFRNFRVIFVDDGSRDNSFQMLKEILEQTELSGIVVHQENKGLPGARNTGIREANAKWITFVDCDDELDPRHLEYLYQSVTESGTQVGYCGFQMTPAEHMERLKPVGERKSVIQTADKWMRGYYAEWFGAWCLIIDRKWLLEQEVMFDEDCTYCEDIPFITQVIASADSVVWVENKTYLYLTRQGSLIRSPRPEKFRIGLDGFFRMAQSLEEWNSEAVRVFRSVGVARYCVATLRKAAVQLCYKDFMSLAESIHLKEYKGQLKNLSLIQRGAGMLFLLSPKCFYYLMHMLFSD